MTIMLAARIKRDMGNIFMIREIFLRKFIYICSQDPARGVDPEHAAAAPPVPLQPALVTGRQRPHGFRGSH